MVYFYRRSRQRRGATVYKSVNGYGYHIIDGGAAAAGNSNTSTGRVGGPPGPNPVEKPPRTHTENFYSTAPVNMYGGENSLDEKPILQSGESNLCPRHAGTVSFAQANLGATMADDSGFIDPEMQPSPMYASSTLPHAKRVLKPAIDDTSGASGKSRSASLQRRNSLPDGPAPLAKDEDESRMVLRETAL